MTDVETTTQETRRTISRPLYFIQAATTLFTIYVINVQLNLRHGGIVLERLKKMAHYRVLCDNCKRTIEESEAYCFDIYCLCDDCYSALGDPEALFNKRRWSAAWKRAATFLRHALIQQKEAERVDTVIIRMYQKRVVELEEIVEELKEEIENLMYHGLV